MPWLCAFCTGSRNAVIPKACWYPHTCDASLPCSPVCPTHLAKQTAGAEEPKATDAQLLKATK
jgi:hypothetical protein